MKKVLMTALAAALLVGSAGIAQAKKVEDLNVDISGLAQLGYSGSQNQAVDDNNGFDVNRLRIKLAAQPADKIAFKGQIEAAGNQNFGSQVAQANPNSRVVDAYVTLSYLDWAKIVIGQMPSPVSYELNTDEYALETIDYSQFVGNFVNRDRGAAIIIPVVDAVDVAAWGINGVGTVGGANDSGDDNAFYGAMINVKPVKDLGIKAFFQTGETVTVAAAKAIADADAFGLGVDYKIYGWHFAGEYVQAKIKNSTETAGVKTIGATTKPRDWYLHASYAIPETGVQLVARYDKLDADTSAVTAGDLSKITTIGLNWDFEKDARLQIMQEFVKDNLATDLKDDNTKVQLSVRF